MHIEERNDIPDAIIRTSKWRLQHLHVVDKTGQVPGLGTINWKEVIRALYDSEVWWEI